MCSVVIIAIYVVTYICSFYSSYITWCKADWWLDDVRYSYVTRCQLGHCWRRLPDAAVTTTHLVTSSTERHHRRRHRQPSSCSQHAIISSLKCFYRLTIRTKLSTTRAFLWVTAELAYSIHLILSYFRHIPWGRCARIRGANLDLLWRWPACSDPCNGVFL